MNQFHGFFFVYFPFSKSKILIFMCSENIQKISWNWFIWFHEFFGLDYLKYSGLLCTAENNTLPPLPHNQLIKKNLWSPKARTHCWMAFSIVIRLFRFYAHVIGGRAEKWPRREIHPQPHHYHHHQQHQQEEGKKRLPTVSQNSQKKSIFLRQKHIFFWHFQK